MGYARIEDDPRFLEQVTKAYEWGGRALLMHIELDCCAWCTALALIEVGASDEAIITLALTRHRSDL